MGEKVLRSELYFGGPNSDLNTARFETLLELKGEIEKIFGKPLDFESLPDKSACRIAIYRPGVISDETNWHDYIRWYLETQKKLRDTLDGVGGLVKLLSKKNS